MSCKESGNLIGRQRTSCQFVSLQAPVFMYKIMEYIFLSGLGLVEQVDSPSGHKE